VSASDRDWAAAARALGGLLAWCQQRSKAPRQARQRFRGMESTRERGFTMSDLNAVLSPVEAGIAVLEEEETQAAQDAEQEGEQTAQEEKQLATYLRKAESAFCKGVRNLLLSRAECGKWSHAIYVLRQEQGHKDRGFTSQIIFNRLAVHADSKREADASEMAKLYKTVELLAEGGNWKSLTVGKLLVLSKLVQRNEGTELYGIFDAGKAEQAKALFTWACGEGMKKPSLEDITNRVLELTDPAKFAEKQAEKAEKAAKDGDQAASENADEEEETPDTENLIAKDADSKPAMPNWKDVPEGMVALYKEAIKQAPGHAGDVMCDFAKELVWTAGMGKSLADGIANSKDAESAMAAMQAMVDYLADEYSVYPSDELAEEAA
jgi:hypothetical protein